MMAYTILMCTQPFRNMPGSKFIKLSNDDDKLQMFSFQTNLSVAKIPFMSSSFSTVFMDMGEKHKTPLQRFESRNDFKHAQKWVLLSKASGI